MAPLPRKQGIPDQAAWKTAIATAAEAWPDDRLDELVETTAAAIRETTRGRRAAIAWSGGKDSLVLAHVAARVGITQSVLAITEGLEFPAFLAWVTDHMPDDLTVLSTGQNLTWLAEHPKMLFPQGEHGPRWFQIVNHRGQDRFFRNEKLDLLLTGRRRADGNYTGPAGADLYRNAKGTVRYSPLAAWSHEAVFALINRENIALPPCYEWPRGFQVGTGAWPARQWTRDVDHGFEEVWEIDPDIIRHAAAVLPAAADWLERAGHTA